MLLILFVNKSKKCSFLPQVLASCNRTMQPNLLPGHLVLSAEASLKSAMDALLQDTLVMPLHFSRFPPARAQVLRTQGLQPMTLHKTLQSLYFSTANLKKKKLLLQEFQSLRIERQTNVQPASPLEARLMFAALHRALGNTFCATCIACIA